MIKRKSQGNTLKIAIDLSGNTKPAIRGCAKDENNRSIAE